MGTRKLTDAQLKALHTDAMSNNPSASRPWVLCHRANGAMLGIDGWYKTQSAARAVGVYLDHAQPIVARMYDRQELRALINHSSRNPS